jgi:UDP-3-O-[3-hydroxymyristoyl] glucosamine N-acyltransferase
MFGGQSGASGHLTIGDRVKVSAKTAIISSIDADTSMSGHPMMETSEWRRTHVVVRKLPEMRKQLKDLADRLAALEEKPHA